MGSFHEGLAQFEHNGKYGFINEEGKTVISPKFESVVEGFTNNRATVMSDNKEVWIDKTGKIISLTDHQKELIAAHTMMNKLTGIVLFLLPLTLSIIDLKYSGIFVCVLATVAAIQELNLIRI